MPFRLNHNPIKRPVFYIPVEKDVEKDEDLGIASQSQVNVFESLPDVEDFSPAVQLKAGVPAKSMSTVLFRPGVSEFNEFAGKLENLPAEKPINNQGVNNEE